MRHTVHDIKLKNGAQGLFIDVPDASVMTFEISFRAGDYLAPPNKLETPHLMEHLLLGANKLIPKSREFQAEFEKNGAYSNASTSSYDITYEAECADFEWERIGNLLQVAISQPLFLDDEFTAEFGNVREELVGLSNNHFRHLSLAMWKATGFMVLTDQERLEIMSNVTVKDVIEHYKKTHTTSNMRFVIGGILPPDRRKQLEEMLEKIALPKGTGRIELPLEKPRKIPRALYIENETVQNLYFYIDTFITKRLSNPELDAVNLMNVITVGTYYSKILGAAREKGLVYHIGSGFSQAKSSSNWWMGAQVLPDNAPELFEIISREVKAVLKGKITDTDVKNAQQYSLGRYQRSGQTVGGTVSGYSGRFFFDGVVDDYYKVPERIAAVTKADAIAVSRELFKKKIWGLGGLGNCGEEFLTKLQGIVEPLWD